MDGYTTIVHRNMLPIFSSLITAKLATLYEIKYVYFYEECLDLFELLLVNNYNEASYNQIQNSLQMSR